MKIWVIGSAGMLGSSLVQICGERKIEVVGTTKQECDVCNLTALQKKCAEIKPTHIVNCAAYTNVDAAENDATQAFAVNAQGAGHIAQIAKDFQARLVHISTDYVFGATKTEPYCEEDLCAPMNQYGMSKWAGEKKVQAILHQACIVRTSWLFGPKGKNFISSLLKWFKEKEELPIVSDQCGRPTYCYDLADAILKLLDTHGIVHFANEGERSRYQIALDLLSCVRDSSIKCQRIIPVQSAQFPTVANRPLYSVLSTDKYRHLTDHKPRSWIEAAQDFIKQVACV